MHNLDFFPIPSRILSCFKNCCITLLILTILCLAIYLKIHTSFTYTSSKLKGYSYIVFLMLQLIEKIYYKELLLSRYDFQLFHEFLGWFICYGILGTHLIIMNRFLFFLVVLIGDFDCWNAHAQLRSCHLACAIGRARAHTCTDQCA